MFGSIGKDKAYARKRKHPVAQKLPDAYKYPLNHTECYNDCARYKKVTACARVHGLSEEKSELLVPEMNFDQ